MNDSKSLVSKTFPSWYRTVCVGAEENQVSLRSNGLQILLKSLEPADLDILLRLIFDMKLSSEELSRVRKPFLTADNSFDPVGNNRELQILCASALASLLELNTMMSARGVLALRTSSVNNQRKLVELPMRLHELGTEAFVRISEHFRDRSGSNLKSTGDLTKIVLPKEIIEKADNGETAAMLAAITASADLVLGKVQAVTRELATRVKRLEQLALLQDEETDMLWWTIGKRSSDLNCPFSEVPANARPLVFAKELAHATEELPGPVCIEALLGHAGLQDKKAVSIPDAVNACDVNWLESLDLKEAEVSSLCAPIHFAILRKLETNDTTAWVVPWRTKTGITESLSPLNLAAQFYYERLQILF